MILAPLRRGDLCARPAPGRRRWLWREGGRSRRRGARRGSEPVASSQRSILWQGGAREVTPGLQAGWGTAPRLSRLHRALPAFPRRSPAVRPRLGARDQARRFAPDGPPRRCGRAADQWIEGQNIQIDFRWASSNVQTMQQFAEELVALHPDVILSSSTPPTRILMQHTRTIPIVFANLVDPVGSKLVESLAKPGGNVTGFVNLEPSIAGKWLELLKEIASTIVRVAVPYNPSTAPYAEIYLNNFKSAGAALALEIVAGPVRDVTELE